jgi:hypothetical protein
MVQKSSRELEVKTLNRISETIDDYESNSQEINYGFLIMNSQLSY